MLRVQFKGYSSVSRQCILGASLGSWLTHISLWPANCSWRPLDTSISDDSDTPERISLWLCHYLNCLSLMPESLSTLSRLSTWRHIILLIWRCSLWNMGNNDGLRLFYFFNLINNKIALPVTPIPASSSEAGLPYTSRQFIAGQTYRN